MAHFAKVNKETNLVENVIVATQAHIYTLDDFEDWVQTSYNGNMRKNYAGIGFTYDAARDAFIPPKPYESWTLNEDTCLWDAPVGRPEEGSWMWDEDAYQADNTAGWVEVVSTPVE